MTTTLQTERLTLRMFRDGDLDDYAALVADPEVMRYIGNGATGDRATAWRHMAMLLGHWQLRGYGVWAVTETGRDRVIGRLGFFNPEGWPGFELGWMLARAARGKGYATEAARAALAYAFDELGRDAVISLIYPEITDRCGSPSDSASATGGAPGWGMPRCCFIGSSVVIGGRASRLICRSDPDFMPECRADARAGRSFARLGVGSSGRGRRRAVQSRYQSPTRM